MQLVDSHCHIHFDKFEDDVAGVVERAKQAGVTKMITVGCTLADSAKACALAAQYDNVWASVGAHPHDGADFLDDEASAAKLLKLAGKSKVVAVGEIGLDYFKDYVPRDKQKATLIAQLDATSELGLPYIFHVREAWADFWPILDKYPNIKGVVHSFSDTAEHAEEVLSRGFYIGLNGIMTFTKIPEQLQAAKQVPLDKLILETDAPFLAPAPYRGQTCEPKHVLTTAEFLAELRGEKLEHLAQA